MAKNKPGELCLLENAIHEAGGNITEAARALHIPRSTLRERLQKLQYDSETTLKARIASLERELDSINKDKLTEDLVKQQIIHLANGVERLVLPTWVANDKTAGSPGVPTLFVSDLHWGEVVRTKQIGSVNSFNMKIARERLHRLAEISVQLLRIISPDMQYPGIVVALGGDMVSGNIHDELTATNELNTMPTVLDIYGELVVFLAQMADTFGKVFVPCVTGNHGRDTRKIWNKDRHATSFDWLLYCLLAKHFELDGRITFFIPDGPDAYYRIYDHKYLLTHGDQFTGGDGVIGALGPIIRGDHRKRSRNAQIEMEYDTLLLGHWHQYIHLTRLVVNGSLKGYDEYCYNNNFGYEVPQQALWLTHHKHDITFRMPVKLQAARIHKQNAWVSIK